MILLINPYITSTERYGKNIGDIGGHQMPLGIYYLASTLIKEKFNVEVLDAEAQGIVHEEVIEILRKSDIKIVGITSTTVAFRNARSLAEIIRKELPDVTIVIGGPHMTAVPVPTMETKAFDFGIVQEGERALLLLVSYLLMKKGNLEDIPNLYYLKNEKVESNGNREVIEDLDSIPAPARHLCPDIKMYKPPVGAFLNKPVASIVTTRGCPYQCIFCDNNTFGRRTRFFSDKYVVEEIKSLIDDFGAKEIAFLDDTFVLDKKRLRKIFELLKNENIKFSWTCMTRVNNLTFELLKFMAENGCWQIRFGIDSGNQKVIDFIKKGITLDQVKQVAKWCKELNIKTTGFFMLGHHIDTPETIQDTIEFALSLPLTDVTATINTPMPGTESYEKAITQEYGTYQAGDWTSLNYWTPVFIPKGLSREFLFKKQSELYRRFYMRPRVIISQLGKIRDFESLRMYMKNMILGLKFLNHHDSDIG